MNINKNAILILFSLLIGEPNVIAKQRDCIEEAAQCFKINPLLIQAIIWQESKNNQQAITKNSNKTTDLGIMQINTVNIDTLNVMGINKTMLTENRCANVFAGSWLLKQHINHQGYTWHSIGSYNSQTPVYRDTYAKKIIRIIAYKTSLISKIKVIEKDTFKNPFHCN